MTEDKGGWDSGPKISPSLGDIEWGLKTGAPSRVLYQQLSEIADGSRGNDSIVSVVVKKGLGKVAEEINKKQK